MKRERVTPVVVRLDRGLSAYVRAFANGVGLYGGPKETAIAFVRESVIRLAAESVYRDALEPHLPADFQAAWRREKK